MTRIDSGWIASNTKVSKLPSKGSAWGEIQVTADMSISVYKPIGEERVQLMVFIESEYAGERECLSTNLGNHQVRTAEDLLELCRLLGVKKDD